jgi:hypothetical protein
MQKQLIKEGERIALFYLPIAPTKTPYKAQSEKDERTPQREQERPTQAKKSSHKAKATRTNNHNPSHKAKFCPYFATKHKNPNKYTPKSTKRNTSKN